MALEGRATFSTMSLWSSETNTNFQRMKDAEDKLLSLAKTFGTRSPDSYVIEVSDTAIPRSAVPLKPLSDEAPNSWDCGCGVMDTLDDRDDHNNTGNDQVDDDNTGGNLNIHSIKVSATTVYDKTNTTTTPLVLLHGYMNAAAYFYRNIVGLCDYYQSVYSVDMLGWGLSSRPSFHQLKNDSLETAENLFVESLEAWRRKHNIERMILCGHSMGGYVSVAYCERYPERVEKLILLSPIGVPDENDPSYIERQERLMSSVGNRTGFYFFQKLFYATTLGEIGRSLPFYKAESLSESYVQKRLPELSDPNEQKALANYILYNHILPGSGEYMIHKVLNSNLLAKKPLQHRIPKLAVQNVSFLYGEEDWMDVSASLSTKRRCDMDEKAPNANVFIVRDSGHLLMMQNWHMTNAVVTYAGGGEVPRGHLPVQLKPGQEDLSDSFIRKTVRHNSFCTEEVMVAATVGAN